MNYLKKAARKHVQSLDPAFKYTSGVDGVMYDSFLAGAAWQREAILKLLRSDQVEKEVKVWALDFADWVENETAKSFNRVEPK